MILQQNFLECKFHYYISIFQNFYNLKFVNRMNNYLIHDLGGIRINKKVLVIFVVTLAFIFCGATSAATPKNSHSVSNINKVGYSSHFQNNPAVSGNIVVWVQEDTERNYAVYYKNLATGAHGKVFPSIKDQEHPAISGTRVVWEQDTPTGTAIYIKNLQTGTYGRVNRSTRGQYNPSIDGTNVVWEQDHNLHHDSYYGDYYDHNVYIKNLVTGSCTRVLPTASDQSGPDISGSRVVWIQDGVLYMKNYSTGSLRRVFSSANRQDGGSIDGARVVWTQYDAHDNCAIYYKNLATGTCCRVQVTGVDQYNAEISGTRVVWYSDVWTDETILACVYVKNMATGHYGKVIPTTLDQTSPRISGTRIVWKQGDNHDNWNPSWSIYTFNLATGRSGKVQPYP